MNGQNLAYLSVVIAALTALMAIVSIILDRKIRQRLAEENRVLRARLKGEDGEG